MAVALRTRDEEGCEDCSLAGARRGDHEAVVDGNETDQVLLD
jgi:hypothetical protein